MKKEVGLWVLLTLHVAVLWFGRWTIKNSCSHWSFEFLLLPCEICTPSPAGTPVHTLPCALQLRSFPQGSQELVSFSCSAALPPLCLCSPSNWGDLWRSLKAAENSHILGWLPKEMH